MDDSLPWERFRDWIHAICVVTFDLELGQALEVIYPGDALLSPQEKTNICYLAFPDSNSGTSKDSNFHFRIRRSTVHLTTAQRRLLDSCSPSAGIDPRYLQGFVHFRQQKDPSIPRGYYQKSVVLISVLPFFSLFSSVGEQIALQFFENSDPAIEAACHDIDQWPLPVAGPPLSLPLLGRIISTRIPRGGEVPFDTRHSLRPSPRDSANATLVLSSVNHLETYTAIGAFVAHLQMLWELVVIGEPLLIIANTPTRCSQIVQGLTSLIGPLRYCNDYRPFFTIHDSEFKEYSTRNITPKVILGVTNPFFIKALDHWPHILKVDDSQNENNAPNGDRKEKAHKTWDGKRLDSKPGMYSQYKPFLIKDKAIAKKLSKSDTPVEVQTAVLQRHFLELTQSFMMPLERYLSSLMPLKKEMSPFKSIPHIRPFVMEDFLSSLEDAGPGLTCGVKGDWAGLYRRFVTSANFGGWWEQRKADVGQQLKSHYVEALCAANLASVVSTKHHPEIVDLVLKIREKIMEMDNADERRTVLIRQIFSILSGVDEELKQILMSNCALREIVG